MNVPTVLLTVVEKAINQYLKLDPVALTRLANYSDKTVAVQLNGFDVTFYIKVKPEGVMVIKDVPENIDTWLIGTPVSLINMALAKESQDSENILFSGDVEIKGDVELGQALKQILNQIEIDLEEQLSKITGDVIAHQVGNLARAGKSWSKKTAETLELDVAEYLQEESQQLPRCEEVEQFLSNVDLIRSDVDRLEARVKRLLSVSKQPENHQPGLKPGHRL
ncbi:MAG: sterol-binding protein [Gammaproteobacteria bacterium]|nr:sterol-binding protein [Gammaproteobacteria bacterium]